MSLRTIAIRARAFFRALSEQVDCDFAPPPPRPTRQPEGLVFFRTADGKQRRKGVGLQTCLRLAEGGFNVQIVVRKCRDCRHWKNSPPDDRGTCERISYEEDGLAITSGEMFSSGFLYTLPNFGCVLWQERSDDV